MADSVVIKYMQIYKGPQRKKEWTLILLLDYYIDIRLIGFYAKQVKKECIQPKLQEQHLALHLRAHLYLCVSALEKGNAQQDALFKHSVILGIDNEINH